MPYLGKEPARVPVTAADIPDDSITAAKIVDGVITAADIGPNAVNTSELVDDAVTADKLANSINTAIAANTAKTGITTSQANAITANTAKVTNATHTGDVTGATALTIAADAVTVDKLNLISTGSVPSLEAKGTSGVTDGYIQLNCAENSHGIKLKSPPHSASASYTLTFPNDDGNADEVLTTNGSGVLTWEAAGGNTTTNGLYEHAHTISSNYSITSGNNAIAAGPITINTGVSVTVPTGSTWVIA